MAEKTFSFEGHISDKAYAPYILNAAFAELPINSILLGTVDHIVPGKHPKAQVLINGHRMPITLWDMSEDSARALVGEPMQVAFTGINDKGWPTLRRLVH